MDNKLVSYSLKYAKKVLSLQDKGEFSPTFGCFDRNYWHYKTITDFPSATYQQCVLYLAHLYSSEMPGNEYYKRKEILNLCIAGIDFWCSIQNKDGSFNEWYPNEHSHVATAFTLYAVTESLLLLKNDIDKDKFKSYAPVFIKACKWLANKPDKQVINHTAGALLSTYNTFLVTGDESLHKYCDIHLSILEEFQSPEGWFYEYYGADIGYTSVSIDFLAKYYEKSGDERVYNLLDKAINFLAFFIHPDGSSGGEYGNRNTKYLMPAGIHILVKYFDEARYILDMYYKGLKNNSQIDLETLDDRYFTFFFVANFIEAANISLTLLPENYEYKTNRYEQFSQIFPQAGIVVKKTKKYYFVCNFKKGGIIKLFSNDGKLLYSDSSYFVRFDNDKVASSQALNNNLEYYIDNSQEYEIEIKFESPFVWVNTELPLTKYLIPFRIFNYTVGNFPLLMDFFNKNLKKLLIVKTSKAPLKIKRHISIKKGKLVIDDAIYKKIDKKVKSINLPSAKTNLHVPSSRYALPYDIMEFIGIDPVCINEINTVNVTCIKTQVEVPNGNSKNEVSSFNTAE